MKSVAPFTPRETQILQMVIASKTNKAIARETNISEKTVEFHLSHIYTKTGERTRLLAVIWAMQQGIGLEASEIPG